MNQLMIITILAKRVGGPFFLKDEGVSKMSFKKSMDIPFGPCDSNEGSICIKHHKDI